MPLYKKIDGPKPCQVFSVTQAATSPLAGAMRTVTALEVLRTALEEAGPPTTPALP